MADEKVNPAAAALRPDLSAVMNRFGKHPKPFHWRDAVDPLRRMGVRKCRRLKPRRSRNIDRWRAQQARERRLEEDAERLKRLSVNLDFVVHVGGGNAADIGWDIRFHLKGSPPADTVSDSNRFVPRGKDWWNDVRDPRAWAHIRQLWTGETKDGEIEVKGERNEPKAKESEFHRLSGDVKRHVEGCAVNRWSFDYHPETDGERVERMIRIFVANTAVIPRYLSELDEERVPAEIVEGFRKATARRGLPVPRGDGATGREILDRVHPAFNMWLEYNPLERKFESDDPKIQGEWFWTGRFGIY